MKTGLRLIAGCLLLASVAPAGSSRGLKEPAGQPFVPLVRIRLLNSELIGDEKTSPPGVARQAFKYMGQQAAWHVTPAPGRIGWAAFSFTRPRDMSGLKSDSVLTFAMVPADMDDRIGIVIEDRNGNVSNVQALSGHRHSELNNRGVYYVPVSGESLDWTGISGVRFVVLKPFDRRITAAVQNLSIEPRAWGRP